MAHRTHPQKSVSDDAKSPTGCIFYPASLFSSHPPTQVNDSTVSLPVSSESGAAERVNDNTTSKPPSDDAEGSVQDRNRCLWGKSWLWIPFNVLSLVSPQWVPLLLQTLRPADFHVSLLSPASSSAPRRHVQRKCSCLESILWKVGTAFLSQPSLVKYLVILRNRFLFSGDIMLYILLPLVARQPLEDLSWTPWSWGVFGSTP